jgi:hypothetical protein
MSKKFLRNRKGTAEVIGSVLFIVILIFFFSNVILWHDVNVSKMNDLNSQKMNSQITIDYSDGESGKLLIVTNVGGVDAVLSRLWITSDQKYLPVPFDRPTDHPLVVKPGRPISIQLTLSVEISSITVLGTDYIYHLSEPFSMTEPNLTFMILTTLGNMGSCSPIT